MVNKRPAGERAAFALGMAAGHTLGMCSAMAVIKNAVAPDPPVDGYQPLPSSETQGTPPGDE